MIKREYAISSLRVMLAQEQTMQLIKDKDLEIAYGLIYDGYKGWAHDSVKRLMSELSLYLDGERFIERKNDVKDRIYESMSLNKYLQLVLSRGYIQKKYRCDKEKKSWGGC